MVQERLPVHKNRNIREDNQLSDFIIGFLILIGFLALLTVWSYLVRDLFDFVDKFVDREKKNKGD